MTETMMGYPLKDPAMQEYFSFDFGFQNDPNSTPRTFDAYKQSGWGAYNPDAQASLYPPSRTLSSSTRGPRSNPPTDVKSNAGHGQFGAEVEVATDELKKPKAEGRKSKLKNLVRGRSKSKSHHSIGISQLDGASIPLPMNQEHQPPSIAQGHASFALPAHPESFTFQQSNSSLQNFHVDTGDFYGSMYHQEGSVHPGMDSAFGTGAIGEQYSNLNPTLFPTTGWVDNLGEIDFSEMVSEPVPTLHHESPLPTHSIRGSRTSSMGRHNTDRDHSMTRPLHSEMSRNRLRNHGSSQTLNSNISSFGENSIMTSSDMGPTLPWLASEYDSRRASDSSELANNVEGMHLQYAPPNLSLVNGHFEPSPHSSAVSINGPTTPDTSPDQLVEKPFATPSDLASRRHRRPTALRPESGRSISHTDPLTQSPHSRSSSVGLAGAGPRRTQSSTVPSLNTQFRVHKLNQSPVQVSPRHLQAHLDKYAATAQRRSAANSGNASPTAFQIHNRPSASAASANRAQADYQHEFHVRSASSGQENNPMYHMPRNANSSVPNLHSAATQGPPQLSIQVPKPYNQAAFHPGLPQSAPPNKTAFFDDSPVHVHGPFAPPHPQAHAYSQGQLEQMTVGTAAMQQGGHLVGHAPMGPLPPFAPQYLFPDGDPSLATFPPQGLVPSYPPQGQPPPAAIELDIKVEVGPTPKLASNFEKCEFNHTFSDKFTHNNDKK